MERYVPANKNSILVDVPGYYGNKQNQQQTTVSSLKTSIVEDSKITSIENHHHTTGSNSVLENNDLAAAAVAAAAVVVGPICWKCHGGTGYNSTKQKKKKQKNYDEKFNTEETYLIEQDNNNKNNKNDEERYKKNVICPVCNGSKHIQCRKLIQQQQQTDNDNDNDNPNKNSSKSVGIITRGRQHISSYQFIGPKPYGYTIPYWGSIVQCATYQCQDEIISTTIPTVARSTTITSTGTKSISTTFNNVDDNSVEQQQQQQQQQEQEQVQVSDQHDPKLLQEELFVLPDWLPQSNHNEQLCNLVGEWRILQKIKSHRWTTDDLVTAYVACKVIEEKILLKQIQVQIHSNKSHGMNYLDLGTGNGSVLQMVLWSSIQQQQQQQQLYQQQNQHNEGDDTTQQVLVPIIESATGLEARYEAVQLARRSIQFNLNTTSNNASKKETPKVQIVHSDFRTYFSTPTTCNNNCSSTTTTTTTTTNTDSNTINGNINNDNNQSTMLYDLITGTPPYFRVDFEVTSSSSSSSNDHDNTNNKNSRKNKSNKVKLNTSNSKNQSNATVDDPKQQQQQHSETYTKRIKVDSQQQQQQQQQQQLDHCDVQREGASESQQNQSIDCANSTTNNAKENTTITTTTTTTSTTDNSSSISIVQRAIIRQGGMPTSIQSAPARCEFRGGIEEYCSIVSQVLKINTGRFIVCINYLNHTRAITTFSLYNLYIHKIYYIHGKSTRPILFCVYVLSKQQQQQQKEQQQADLRSDTQQDQQHYQLQQTCYDGAIASNTNNNDISNKNLSSTSSNELILEEFHIAVRDHNGELTTEYKETVLKFMGIPYV